MNRDEIRKAVAYYTKKFQTRDPFELADCLKIKVYKKDLGSVSGLYRYMKRHRVIYLNSNIEDHYKLRVIMAHELGHALLHSRAQTYFMEHHTLLKTSHYEKEANYFAAELLLDDDFMLDNRELTIYELIRLTGFSEGMLNLKFNCYAQPK